MTVESVVEKMNEASPERKWRDLYRIGAVTSILFPILILLAVVAFFIWPYTPGFVSLEEIFRQLHTDRLGGLMSMDLVMVLMEPVLILHLVAVYAALKRVNESYALVALVLGLIGNVLILTARPMVEMVYLSDQYMAATTESAQLRYLAAGEALHALFNGTAWVWWNVLTVVSYTISSFLMLGSNVFNRATAYVGLALFVFGITFWLPGIGPILSLLATVGSIVWFLMQAPAFINLGWRTYADGKG